MNWLVEIIKHIFPRKNWKMIAQHTVVNNHGRRIGVRYVLQDQFGNIKSKTFFAK